MATPDPKDNNEVAHAVALFRTRAADRDSRRSSIVVLARVLEQRRQLLKDSMLFRRDEAALFQIANEFDLRHRKESQKEDYDDVFLDWIFWQYMATIELTDRLLARSGESNEAP